ncbi:hypothetical protein GCM10018783_64300 [Streptomyces griseosporeus]|nr:hypothetical protein GCM10018783_64300 [Streptomyces griseosporeus]
MTKLSRGGRTGVKVSCPAGVTVHPRDRKGRVPARTVADRERGVIDGERTSGRSIAPDFPGRRSAVSGAP